MTAAARTRPARATKGGERTRRSRSLVIALLLVAGGAVLGWVLPRWENDLPAGGLAFEASTAQATLAAIAGGMITLAGFVVTAITLVVQTVQAMSPRLVAALGHYSRYLVLFGLLIGTALYALVALSQVRDESVPRLTVTLAIGLVLVDAVTVLNLLASLRQAVTGGGLARAVGNRLRTVVEETGSERAARDGVREDVGGQGAGAGSGTVATVVHEGAPALVVAFDERRLVRLAARHSVTVHLLVATGEFVSTGRPVARVVGAGAVPARFARQLAGCLRHGPSRTVEQDPAYGFRLLADIAIRALSPAVNDPTTAIQALDQTEDALLRLAVRPLGATWLVDRAGGSRVLLPGSDWADLVSLALDETLLYGASGPQTVRRLRALLDRVSAAAPAVRRPPLAARRAALDRMSAAALSDPLLHEVASHADPQGLGGPHSWRQGLS